MEVILRQAVENLGHPGDMVKVSAGFARNYLLPRGIAVAATDGNRKRIALEKARLEAEKVAAAQALAAEKAAQEAAEAKAAAEAAAAAEPAAE